MYLDIRMKYCATRNECTVVFFNFVIDNLIGTQRLLVESAFI